MPGLRLFSFLLCSFLLGCQPQTPAQTARGGNGTTGLRELRVAGSFDGVNFRRESVDRLAGFEHDLITAFAAAHNLPIRFIPVPDGAHALQAVTEGRAHLAAGNIEFQPTPTLLWSNSLGKKQLVLVGRNDQPVLDTAARIQGRLVAAVHHSSAAQAVLNLQKEGIHAQITYPIWSDEATLLTRLSRNTFDYVVTDMAHFRSANLMHPKLQVAYLFPQSIPTAWAISPQFPDLKVAIDDFLDSATRDGLIERLEDRYFGTDRNLDEFDLRTFQARIQERLPKYQPYFEAAAAQTGLDWRFLAAVSYQESHWDPEATSYTGVRGLMMLTSETADRLGVENRLDPQQSILGGARYLTMLMESMPPQAPEEDRRSMALAAYNIGLGHFNSVRTLARATQPDDLTWFNLKQALLLAQRPEHARYFRSGRPRGAEAVAMAEGVNMFYDVLLRTYIESPLTLKVADNTAPRARHHTLGVSSPRVVSAANELEYRAVWPTAPSAFLAADP